MVDLKEKEMFDSDIEIALRKPILDDSEARRIITEQQRFIRSLVSENGKLREKILDDIIG